MIKRHYPGLVTMVLAREYSLVTRITCYDCWGGKGEDTKIRRVSTEAGFRTSQACVMKNHEQARGYLKVIKQKTHNQPK